MRPIRCSTAAATCRKRGSASTPGRAFGKGAPKLKAIGHPVGLGMSNEIDSNMMLTSLLYCYGGFIQNEENRIVIGQGANRKGAIEALTVMRDIYRNGMSDEVFAWTAASNNQAFLAGRLSVALNAISIARSAEHSGNTALSDDTWLVVDPARSAHAHGQRARHGRLRDLEVREEQGGGEEVPRSTSSSATASTSFAASTTTSLPGRARSRAGSRRSASCPRRTRTSREASTPSSRRSPRSTRRTRAIRATRRR